MARPLRNRKAKGIAAERELIHMFHKLTWSAVRIAGSGSTKYPAPDVLAGNGFRRVAIEAKFTSDTKKYFSQEDITQLMTFAKNFGCEFWLAVKFGKEPWYFIHPEDLQGTKTAFVATLQRAKLLGLSMDELVNR